MMHWNSLESYSLATSHALEEAALTTVSSATKLIVKVVLALVTCFVLWAAFFHIDILASGSGKVVPVRSVQQLQSLEAGLVAEIFVHEGEIVKKGQVLMKLNPAQAQSDVAERTATREGLLASIARLRADSDGSEPVYPAELRATVQGKMLIDSEEKLRRERANSLSSQVAVLASQRSQRGSDVAERRDRLPELKKSLKLVHEQIAMTEPLVTSGSAAPGELIQLRKEESNLRAQIVTVEQGMISSSAQVGEMQARIGGQVNQFRAEARDELSKREVQLRSLEGALGAKEDILNRTELRAPVDGVVKTLAVTTVGGVATPGRTLVEIVPLDDTLLVEARVSPSDIANIRPRQRAKVRITAFDSGMLGSLDGTVERVSPDSQTDEKSGETYFRVYVRTNVSSIETTQGKLFILPGMLADIDIITGKRTVMNYLLRPVARGLSRSMGEN
jgi:adhesin transport system membrane fusion protein